MSTLPADSEERKGYPLMSGCLNYFPAALAGVARWSKLGNDKHNPGEPLHHARGKSMDHGDCILRHLVDLQGMLASLELEPRIMTAASAQPLLDEADALAWRALALSQELRERFGNAPLAPAARLPMGQMVSAALGQIDINSGHGSIIGSSVGSSGNYGQLTASEASSVSGLFPAVPEAGDSSRNYNTQTQTRRTDASTYGLTSTNNEKEIRRLAAMRERVDTFIENI